MTTYYRHSGKFAVDAPFTALAAGLPAALVLSWVYAYAILYIPIVGIVTFILTGGLGLGVGLATGAVLKARKVRNNLLAWSIGAFVGFVTLWLSWVSWTVGLIGRADGDASWLAVLFSPGELWQVVLKVNEVGAWSFKGATPTGGILWVLWACEALMIVGITAWATALMVENPYCEQCGKWCDHKRGVAAFADRDFPLVKEKLEGKDFAGAIALAGGVSDPNRWLRLEVTECAGCGETNTLSVVPVTVKEKGPEDGTPVVRHLLLSRLDVGNLSSLSAVGERDGVRA